MLSPFNGDWSVHSTKSDVICCFVLLHPSFANPNLIALLFSSSSDNLQRPHASPVLKRSPSSSGVQIT